jgi:hypothetical protein
MLKNHQKIARITNSLGDMDDRFSIEYSIKFNQPVILHHGRRAKSGGKQLSSSC